MSLQSSSLSWPISIAESGRILNYFFFFYHARDYINMNTWFIFFFEGITEQTDNSPTLLLRAKAFLGILVLNNSTNSTTANSLYLH